MEAPEIVLPGEVIAFRIVLPFQKQYGARSGQSGATVFFELSLPAGASA
jgi:hypothetical protein